MATDTLIVDWGQFKSILHIGELGRPPGSPTDAVGTPVALPITPLAYSVTQSSVTPNITEIQASFFDADYAVYQATMELLTSRWSSSEDFEELTVRDVFLQEIRNDIFLKPKIVSTVHDETTVEVPEKNKEVFFKTFKEKMAKAFKGSVSIHKEMTMWQGWALTIPKTKESLLDYQKPIKKILEDYSFKDAAAVLDFETGMQLAEKEYEKQSQYSPDEDPPDVLPLPDVSEIFPSEIIAGLSVPVAKARAEIALQGKTILKVSREIHELTMVFVNKALEARRREATELRAQADESDAYCLSIERRLAEAQDAPKEGLVSDSGTLRKVVLD